MTLQYTHLLRALCTAILSFPLALAFASADVTPPKVPQMRDADDTPYDNQTDPQQPKALESELMVLTQGSVAERVAKLKRKVINDLVFIKGGTFMMGDFGPLWTKEKSYYTSGLDNKPPRKVALTGFSIARYKSTYAELDVFADATGQQRAGMQWRDGIYRHPLIPAGMYWKTAKDYCTWLGKETGVPFDLPTEAQWEYAARSGGQFFVWATDNGSLEPGRNIASTKQRRRRLLPIVEVDPHDPESVTRAMAYPVGIFPPNPIGLYDMNGNGGEWMQDWYAHDEYGKEIALDPKGPASGAKRVVRGQLSGSYERATNVVRLARDPMLTEPNIRTGKVGPGFAIDLGVRCAVNLDKPVAQTQ